MKIECCKDCMDRSIGCHDKCERYIQEKAEYDELQALIKSKRKADSDIRDVKRKSLDRMLKK